MPKTKQEPSVDSLRHAEYYGMQQTYDDLYAKSKNGELFPKLMDIVLSRGNILLAYRNIKANSGSNTPGTDQLTIENIGCLSTEEIVDRVRRIVNGKRGYWPKPVRRKDIPKPNGSTRPLGIPCIWDRLIADAGVQRPLVFSDLLRYPAKEARAVTNPVRFPRTLSVRLISRFSAPCRVSGLPAFVALSGRCAALQLVSNGGWGASDRSGNGSVRVACVLEILDCSAFFTLKVLSLLAFYRFCDIILAVHSDCPPLEDVVYKLHSTMRGKSLWIFLGVQLHYAINHFSEIFRRRLTRFSKN